MCIRDRMRIDFAHGSFLWSNGAVGRAGVTCVVVGLAERGNTNSPAKLYVDGIVRNVAQISPYLVADGNMTVVKKRSEPISPRVSMAFGCRPIDDGYLVLDEAEAFALVDTNPRTGKFIRPYLGASELLHSTPRFCVWISDGEVSEALQHAAISQRVEQVRQYRSASTSRDTPKWADRPHRFVYINHEEAQCLAAPGLCSERRDYMPFTLLAAGPCCRTSFMRHMRQPLGYWGFFTHPCTWLGCEQSLGE